MRDMKCHHYLNNHCLSCDLLSHDYASSILRKEKILSELFAKHADKIKASAICPNSEYTRNKAKLAVAFIDNEIEFGFYDRHRTFKKLADCPLHAPSINHILPALKKHL